MAPLERDGNKCGVQLTHGSHWGAALPTAPLKQLKDLFCLEHCPCPAAESTGSAQGGSGVCAGLGLGWREGLSQAWLRTAPGAVGMCLPNTDSSCTAGTDGDTQLWV